MSSREDAATAPLSSVRPRSQRGASDDPSGIRGRGEHQGESMVASSGDSIQPARVPPIMLMGTSYLRQGAQFDAISVPFGTPPHHGVCWSRRAEASGRENLKVGLRYDVERDRSLAETTSGHHNKHTRYPTARSGGLQGSRQRVDGRHDRAGSDIAIFPKL